MYHLQRHNGLIIDKNFYGMILNSTAKLTTNDANKQTITMNNELKNYIERLTENYNGDPWYGRPLLSILNEVGSLNAWGQKVNNNHTNTTLLRHIVLWRLFTISRFKPDAVETTIYFDDNNWQTINNPSKEDWERSMAELANSQQELLRIISTANGSMLDEQVPGRTYTFRYLLNGLIEHDIYHTGQIMLSIKKNA